MTDEQIIDLLAAKVMGWTLSDHGNYWNGPGAPSYREQIWREAWNPLQHIQHAWMVVEKLRKELCCFKLDSDHDFFWEACGIRDEDDEDHGKCISDWKIHVSHKSICRAIALAALKAHGIVDKTTPGVMVYLIPHTEPHGPRGM